MPWVAGFGADLPFLFTVLDLARRQHAIETPRILPLPKRLNLADDDVRDQGAQCERAVTVADIARRRDGEILEQRLAMAKRLASNRDHYSRVSGRDVAARQ